ncbi:three-Cys-motif partner protein TcmP [Spirosoma aerolatum]|uniref:three-Cys-motif partner protein TcmP n=1 Tax=Spirosoma aerolatum TaxID=1211326 RepID=UPI0009AD092D|nr:three-Cys-motif partner protein TcmP [Spirosoma aerolatum]
MSVKDFFKKQTASSLIKAKIVAEYFPQYARILLSRPQEEIIYLDLFSGPGEYEDGSLSTPILLSQHVAKDANLSEKVRLMFNDNTYIEELKVNFHKHFPVGTFKIEPRFADKTVGEDEGIQDYLSREAQKKNPKPTLLFFDPFGYKDIDTKILAKFLEHWGNELFLFFNIKRINAAIENDKFEELMRAIFPTSFDSLKHDKRYKSTVYERLNLIIENVAKEFNLHCKRFLYHCAFKFQEEDSSATSHFIIHFTKDKKGFELVKQIYYDFDNIGSILESSGVYMFDAKKLGSLQQNDTLFGDLNVYYLSLDLVERFKGQTLSARRLFDIHHTTKNYCASHYAKTLRKMVDDEKISAKFIDNIAHKVSVLITDECILTFK